MPTQAFALIEQLTLQAGSKADAKGYIGADRHTAVIVVRPVRKDFTAQVSNLKAHGRRIGLTLLPSKGAELKITYEDRIVAFEIDAHVGRRQSEVSIRIGTGTVVETLRQHLQGRVSKEMPSTFVARYFRDAERAYYNGDYEDAGHQYEALREDFALQSWASLRLADIVTLTESVHLGCERYQAVLDEFLYTTSGRLARLRMYWLGCDSAAVRQEAMQESLYDIATTDGLVGQFLWEELLEAMAAGNTRERLLFALNVVTYRRPGIRKFRERVLARLLRMDQSPFERAYGVTKYRGAMLRHPESGSMALLGAQSMLAVDLRPNALPFVEQRSKTLRGPLWRERFGTWQILNLRAHILHRLGKNRQARRIAAKVKKQSGADIAFSKPQVSSVRMSDLDPSVALADVELRLRAASRATDAYLKDLGVYKGGRR